jgi:hypothetical protein
MRQSRDVFTDEARSWCLHWRGKVVLSSLMRQSRVVFTDEAKSCCLHWWGKVVLSSLKRQSRVVFTEEAKSCCLHRWDKVVLSSLKRQSRVVLTDVTGFHISGRVIARNTPIFGSEPRGKHVEHEWDNPEVNVLCWLTHETVICPFVFDENASTGNSFLDVLEAYPRGVPQ